jgi:hypothetical protein
MAQKGVHADDAIASGARGAQLLSTPMPGRQPSVKTGKKGSEV